MLMDGEGAAGGGPVVMDLVNRRSGDRPTADDRQPYVVEDQPYLVGTATDRPVEDRAATPATPGPLPCAEIERAVRPVVVDLIAGFEPLRMPSAELAGLQVGDVIRTHHPVDRPLVARVGDERLFHLRQGARGHRLIAEVTGHVEPSDQAPTNTEIDTEGRS